MQSKTERREVCDVTQCTLGAIFKGLYDTTRSNMTDRKRDRVPYPGVEVICLPARHGQPCEQLGDRGGQYGPRPFALAGPATSKS